MADVWMSSLRRAAPRLVTAGAAMAGLVLAPHSEPGGASGYDLLRTLPAGVAGALVPYGGLVHDAYEVCVRNVACTGIDVQLCGVSHLSPASAKAARAAVMEATTTNGTSTAVALECDTQSLALIRCAHGALAGLTPKLVRSEGVGRVCTALSRAPLVRAEREGACRRALSRSSLPSAISRHLKRDGVLWSAEMGVAADAADAAGARVVCLGGASSPPATPPVATALSASTPPSLGVIACRLRARMLSPGLDELSCDAADIEAISSAMRETLPDTSVLKLTAPDAEMASALRALCDERPPPRVVVAVVGAQHVAGIARQLEKERTHS